MIAVHKNEDRLFDIKWAEYLRKYGCEVVELDFKKAESFEKVLACDGAMWHYHHDPYDKQVAPKILDTIEKVCGIPVWPNYYTRWHFDEKVSQSYILKALNEPSVKSWIFWNKEDALDFIKKARFPLVFKLSVGAGSANIVKVNSAAEAEKYIIRMFDYGIYPYSLNEYEKSKSLKVITKSAIKQYLYPEKLLLPTYYQVQKGYVFFQEFIQDNAYDIRVTIIGNRAFGFIRYNRKDDFRASGSGMIEYDIKKIPREAIETAFRISDKMGFQSMAYDFLMDSQGRCLVNEMSYGYMDKAVYDCGGHWDRAMQWHEGHMWPEEAHVIDFIDCIKKSRNCIS